MTSPYRDAAVLYFDAGWPGPLPLPANAKRDPPTGYTGANGGWPSRADIETWRYNGEAGHNIALRLPDDVIGIDVDMYDGKQGRETLARLEADWGPLPDTWMSSSRDDGSGIRFYRVAAGRKWPSVPGPGIEIIQHGHRYAVVWPSVHPNGKRYDWQLTTPAPAFRVNGLEVPRPEDMTELPARWVDGLANFTPAAGTGWTDPDVDQLLLHGIPSGQNQDETLRDFVWKMRSDGYSLETARNNWATVVAKSPQLDPSWPWDTGKDFGRHWYSADRKLPRPLTVLDSTPAQRPVNEPERPSLLLTRSQLRNLPTPEPLITSTIDLRTVVLVAGYWGTLKSFLAIDWACCIATGRPWMGRDPKVGPVLYVAAEGAYGVGPRLDAWEFAWKHGEMIADDLFSVYPRPINLLEPAQVAELAAMADGRMIVVVDTLARCLVGGDENSAKDMGVAVDSLYKVRDATGGGSVVVLHHTGKDKVTTRGSSALEAGVDTVYQTEGDFRHTILTRTKRKDGPVEDRHELILNNHLESGCISVHVGLDSSPNDQTVLSTFLSSFEDGGTSQASLEKATGLSHSSFSRSLQTLVRAGKLRKEGSQTRPFIVKGNTQ